MTVYLDMNATTPVHPVVFETMKTFFLEEYGNAGSRTHEFGARAKKAVQNARHQIAGVVKCDANEVLFTSGATEANNLAILGLEAYGKREGRLHIVSTAIEHKAVLEPLDEMTKRGFEVTLISPGKNGRVDAGDVVAAVRPDTLLVSIMHANNETGIIQPVEEIAAALVDHESYLHVDAAQTFGKLNRPLQIERVDLVSISGHKIFGPMGIGSLIARSRNYARPPLTPLMYGGGQEWGLRPGTLPVPLIVGLGAAGALSEETGPDRATKCQDIRTNALQAFAALGGVINGDPALSLDHVINISIPGANSEALMVALKGVAAVSNGSACTSASYEPSHVLKAMDLSKERILNSIRISWASDNYNYDWDLIVNRIKNIM
jgi:cysteine desulfurase